MKFLWLSSAQAASDGPLAVLPLLTPIGCDPDAPTLAEEGGRRRRAGLLSGGGHPQRSHRNASCEASEDELCDRALVPNSRVLRDC